MFAGVQLDNDPVVSHACDISPTCRLAQAALFKPPLHLHGDMLDWLTDACKVWSVRETVYNQQQMPKQTWWLIVFCY
jgi:hypothetical protein